MLLLRVLFDHGRHRPDLGLIVQLLSVVHRSSKIVLSEGNQGGRAMR